MCQRDNNATNEKKDHQVHQCVFNTPIKFRIRSCPLNKNVYKFSDNGGHSKLQRTEAPDLRRLYLKVMLMWRYIFFFLRQVRAWMMNKCSGIQLHRNNYYIVVIQIIYY